LQRQTERTVSMQAEANERLRRTTSLELAAARDAIGALRTELVAQTAATLAEQTRAQQQALQTGLQNASVQLTSSIESLTRTMNERLEALSGRV
ncbi:hypothetical protein ABTD78_19695, partial [Acinetobacter baumannii]